MAVNEKPIYSDTVVTGVGTLDHFALLEAKEKSSDAKAEDSKYFKANVFFDSPLKIAKLQAAIDDLLAKKGWTIDMVQTTGVKTYEQKIKTAQKPESYDYLKGNILVQTKKKEGSAPILFFKYDRASKSKEKITDPNTIKELFYRGAKVMISLSAGTYQTDMGNKGISLYTSNILFIDHGTPLSGATGAEFDSVDVDYEFAEPEVDGIV